MIEIFKRHYFILFFAVAAVAVICLPQIWLQQDLGDDYQGVYFGGNDSETYYAGRIHDVYDGHPGLGNAFTVEYKDSAYIQPPLPEIILAGLGYLSFSKEIASRIFFASRVALPFFLFILIYAFVYRFTSSRGQGLLGTLLIFFGMDLVQNPRGFLDFFQFKFSNNSPVVFSRPVSPQMGMFFFFGYALFFWEWLKTKKNIFLYSAGIVLGLGIYIYFYTWAFILAANGFLGMYFFFTKSFENLKKLILLHLTALVVAIPYLLNLKEFYTLPNTDFLAFHAGMFPSRNFYMNWSAIVGFFVVILFWVKNRPKQVWLSCLMLGGFLAINQQVLSGRELTPAHFHWYFISPVFGLIGLMVFFRLLKLETRKILKIVSIVVMAGLLFTTGFVKQQKSYAHYRIYYQNRQKYGEVYTWLNQNTQTDSTVLVFDRNEGDNIAAFTHNNPYFSSFMFLSNTPSERLTDMHYLEIMLQGVTAETADKFFRDNPNRVADLIGGLSTRRIYGCRTCYPEEERIKAVKQFKDYYEQGAEFLLDKYELDYVIIDTQKDERSMNILPKSTLITEVGDFEIYSYN